MLTNGPLVLLVAYAISHIWFILFNDYRDLDEELQDALYEFLEARGVNDDLAVFLHDYMMNKDRIELIRWLGNLKSFIEK